MRLNDEQWRQLAPLLTGTEYSPGVRAKNNRLYIEAVLWVVTHQRAWRNLPPEFGRPFAAYMRFRRWNASGFWHQLAQAQLACCELRTMLGKIADHGDLYMQRAALRLARKANRIAYGEKNQATANRPEWGRTSPETSDSSLHWLGLVLSPEELAAAVES
ncbi:transposase [Herbaspirillum rhizosphaerae]|uniref:transposase n=1 Tax=Herbaspirillum rhizosphaerae TaxID=346179 RepID=UPI00067B4215|nr:transposase [Herbaspirillum rhizosphaerae]